MGVTIHIGGISLNKTLASSFQQISIQNFINKRRKYENKNPDGY